MIYSFHNQRWCMNIRSEMFSIKRVFTDTSFARRSSLRRKTNERDGGLSWLTFRSDSQYKIKRSIIHVPVRWYFNQNCHCKQIFHIFFSSDICHQLSFSDTLRTKAAPKAVEIPFVRNIKLFNLLCRYHAKNKSTWNDIKILFYERNNGSASTNFSSCAFFAVGWLQKSGNINSIFLCGRVWKFLIRSFQQFSGFSTSIDITAGDSRAMWIVEKWFHVGWIIDNNVFGAFVMNFFRIVGHWLKT